MQEEDVDALKRNDINETASSVGQSHGAETATDPKSQELQNLVDSLQEKTEKEVARIIKVSVLNIPQPPLISSQGNRV